MSVRSLLAVAALATCSASAAMAADLPMRSAPPAPFYAASPIFSWTGFYAGVNAGASFDNRAGRVTPNGFTPANGFRNATGDFGSFRGGSSDVGFVGGAQIGYNVQTGMFVYGLEADADYFGGGSSGRHTVANSDVFPNGSLTLNRRSGDGYLGTVRGRLGLAAFDRTLLYVTGGLAFGDYGTSYRSARFSNAAGDTSVDFNSRGDQGGTRVGYALGAGIEYALSQKVSVKAEYLYTDLGSRNYGLYNSATSANFTSKSDSSAQVARVGLNYHF